VFTSSKTVDTPVPCPSDLNNWSPLSKGATSDWNHLTVTKGATSDWNTLQQPNTNPNPRILPKRRLTKSGVSASK